MRTWKGEAVAGDTEEGRFCLVFPQGGRPVLEVHGPVDAATVAELVAELELAESDLLVDMTGATFLNSVALGRILETVRDGRARGVTIVVVHASEVVRRVVATDPTAAATLGLSPAEDSGS